MITKQEFLKAKKIISDYKKQEKEKVFYISKVDLYLSKSNEEIINSIKPKIENNKILRYSRAIELISESYFYFFNSKLGTNNLKKCLLKLIERGVFKKSGYYKFQEYKLNN